MCFRQLKSSPFRNHSCSRCLSQISACARCPNEETKNLICSNILATVTLLSIQEYGVGQTAAEYINGAFNGQKGFKARLNLQMSFIQLFIVCSHGNKQEHKNHVHVQIPSCTFHFYFHFHFAETLSLSLPLCGNRTTRTATHVARKERRRNALNANQPITVIR